MAVSKRRMGFKLLVASAGVATVNYVAACDKPPPPITGNLPSPPPPAVDAGVVPETPPTAPTAPIVGNLPAPPPPIDAGVPDTKQPDSTKQ